MLKLVSAFDMNFESVLDYYNSFIDKWKDLNNYGISLAGSGYERYYEYINYYDPYLYYLVDDNNPKYILGYGSFEKFDMEKYHNPYLNIGGIGYGVRPNERKKGYGKEILRLILIECEKEGMKEVCISCKKENIASRKIILANKGKLEKEFFDDDSGKKCLKFWIKLHPKIMVRARKYINSNKKQYIRLK